MLAVPVTDVPAVTVAAVSVRLPVVAVIATRPAVAATLEWSMLMWRFAVRLALLPAVTTVACSKSALRCSRMSPVTAVAVTAPPAFTMAP